MITAAAIMIDGVVQSLPKPNRHHNIIHKFPKPGHQHGEQGFIDSELGFVSREVAKVIAIASGQLQKPKNSYSEKLFSEDLW